MTLREIEDRDWGWIAAATERWQPSQRWSLGGCTPSPRRIADLLGMAVSIQKAVWLSGAPAGVAQIVNVDEVSGYGSLGLLIDPDQTDDVRASLIRFVDEAFGELQLRKLCIATYADELDVPRSLGPGPVRVGRLRGHRRRREDVYVDRLVYELWRPDLDPDLHGELHPPTEGGQP